MANLTKRDIVVKISNDTGLVQHQVLEFILDPRAYLHQLMSMDEQLAMVTHPGAGYPDARKTSFHQQLQNMFCISSIRFLLPDIAGTDLRCIPDPHFMAELLQ